MNLVTASADEKLGEGAVSGSESRDDLVRLSVPRRMTENQGVQGEDHFADPDDARCPHVLVADWEAAGLDAERPDDPCKRSRDLFPRPFRLRSLTAQGAHRDGESSFAMQESGPGIS